MNNNKSCRKPYPWELRKLSYTEWGSMDFDWNNYYKSTFVANCYLRSYETFAKRHENSIIFKSTFGERNISEVHKEINHWFQRCIGAHNEIQLTPQNPQQL